VSYKKLELLTLREHLNSSLGFMVGSVLLIFLLLCIVLLCVFTFWVPNCDVIYDFRIKPIFDSSWPPVVWRRSHVLFPLCVFVRVYWCPTDIVLYFCFIFLRLVCPMLPVFLDCQLLIVPSVFSNVYFSYICIRR